MAEQFIFEEQDLAFSSSGIEGLYLWQVIPATVALTDGVEYTVRWDSQTYLCTAITANLDGIDCVGIGNLALAGLGENTGEPFLIGAAADGSFAACYTTDNKETIPVAIYQVVEETDDADYLIKGSTLTAIADAIRAKTGKAEAISVSSMPLQIAGISGGGTSADVCYVRFMSYDGAVEYGRKAVAVGDDCADPIERGLFTTPTRESTAQYSYTFCGWANTPNSGANANWNKAITEDKTVYANFVSALRYYTITYYDGIAVLKSESLAYGAVPAYVPKKEGFVLAGWQPELAAVTSDASYYAQWRELAGFDKLFGVDVTKTFDVAINNAGTMLSVAAGSSATKDPLVYDISGGTPVQLSTGGGVLCNWRGVAFNYDDSKMRVECYLASDYSHKIRTYTTTANPATCTYASQITSDGNSPIAASPVADDFCGYRWTTGKPYIYQYPGNPILLNNSARSIVYSPDGVHIAVATDTGASVYDRTTAVLASAPHSGAATKVSYNADGSLLAVSCSAAPYVAIYETTNYTKVCDLADVMTTAGVAEFVGNDTLVVGTGTDILVYTVTESGIKDFAYNVPAYAGTTVKDIVKNHNSTRLVIRGESNVEVWSYI